MKSKKAKGKRQKAKIRPVSDFCLFTFAFLLFTFVIPVAAQKVAVITPQKTEAAAKYSGKFESSLSGKLRVLDDSMGESAFSALAPGTPFNLTTEESRKIGSAIGCDFFILIRPSIIRRSAFKRAEYYEASAAIYVVSSRTGRLVFWRLPRFETDRSGTAEQQLLDSVQPLVSEIVSRLKST